MQSRKARTASWVGRSPLAYRRGSGICSGGYIAKNSGGAISGKCGRTNDTNNTHGLSDLAAGCALRCNQAQASAAIWRS